MLRRSIPAPSVCCHESFRTRRAGCERFTCQLRLASPSSTVGSYPLCTERLRGVNGSDCLAPESVKRIEALEEQARGRELER